MMCVIIDYVKFSPQIFLEEEFYDKQAQNKGHKHYTQQDCGIDTCVKIRKNK